jgi:hypothetical protein
LAAVQAAVELKARLSMGGKTVRKRFASVSRMLSR